MRILTNVIGGVLNSIVGIFNPKMYGRTAKKLRVRDMIIGFWFVWSIFVAVFIYSLPNVFPNITYIGLSNSILKNVPDFVCENGELECPPYLFDFFGIISLEANTNIEAYTLSDGKNLTAIAAIKASKTNMLARSDGELVVLNYADIMNYYKIESYNKEMLIKDYAKMLNDKSENQTRYSAISSMVGALGFWLPLLMAVLTKLIYVIIKNDVRFFQLWKMAVLVCVPYSIALPCLAMFTIVNPIIFDGLIVLLFIYYILSLALYENTSDYIKKGYVPIINNLNDDDDFNRMFPPEMPDIQPVVYIPKNKRATQQNNINAEQPYSSYAPNTNIEKKPADQMPEKSHDQWTERAYKPAEKREPTETRNTMEPLPLESPLMVESPLKGTAPFTNENPVKKFGPIEVTADELDDLSEVVETPVKDYSQQRYDEEYDKIYKDVYKKALEEVLLKKDTGFPTQDSKSEEKKNPEKMADEKSQNNGYNLADSYFNAKPSDAFEEAKKRKSASDSFFYDPYDKDRYRR